MNAVAQLIAMLIHDRGGRGCGCPIVLVAIAVAGAAVWGLLR